MTISSTTNRVSYTGNAVTTDFSFPYKFLANADLNVYLEDVLQTITTHYTVTGAGDDSGGTVSFLTAPPNSDSVVIVRDPAITQGLDLVENDPLPAESIEESLDKLTIICQRLGDRIDRSVTIPDFVEGVDANLPAPEAGKLIGWNPTGDGFENYTSLTTTNADSVIYTPSGTGTTARTVETKLREFVSILDFGGAGDNSTDNTTALNAAIASIASNKTTRIYFPAGTYKFNSKPDNITKKVFIHGDGKSATILYRNYNGATSSDGLFNLRPGSNGSVIADLGILSLSGTTGGSLISNVSDASSAADFCRFSNLYLSTTGTDTHNYAVWFDGSLRTSGAIGIRDTFFDGCSIFGGVSGAVYAQGVQAFHIENSDTFQAGGTTGKIIITGDATVPSNYVSLTGSTCNGLGLDRVTYLTANYSVISGDVSNANTANHCSVIGLCSGTVQTFWVNSSYQDHYGNRKGQFLVEQGVVTASFQQESVTKVGTIGFPYQTPGVLVGQTISITLPSSKLIAINTGGGAAVLMYADYKSATVTLLANPSGEFEASSTPAAGKTGIYKTGTSNHTIYIKNNTAGTINYSILCYSNVSGTQDPF
jgi:hypothetical protein